MPVSVSEIQCLDLFFSMNIPVYQYRFFIFAQSLMSVLYILRKSDGLLPRKIARETILAINRINNRYKSLIEHDSEQSYELRENVGNWIARVNFGGTLKE